MEKLSFVAFPYIGKLQKEALSFQESYGNTVFFNARKDSGNTTFYYLSLTSKDKEIYSFFIVLHVGEVQKP